MTMQKVNERPLHEHKGMKSSTTTLIICMTNDNLHNLGPWVNIGGVGTNIGSLHQLLALPQWLDLVKGGFCKFSGIKLSPNCC